MSGIDAEPVIALETERMILTRPRLSDAASLFAFLGDADVMRYTRADSSLKACRQRIAAHERQRRRIGAAPWTVRLKHDGRVIGWGGLYEDPFDPGWGIELAYFFHPQVQGRGLGSEFVSAATDHADRALRLSRLAAFASRENKASRRLLEKAGFIELRYLPDMGRLYYERDRPA